MKTKEKHIIHTCPNIEELVKTLPSDVVCSDLSDFFKIFGDYSRIRLLFALKNCEMCVQDISDLLGMQHSAVSHQLKTLRQYKLVSTRRDGKKSYYSLNDNHIFQILEIGKEHISHK